jgi:hypothetical protein
VVELLLAEVCTHLVEAVLAMARLVLIPPLPDPVNKGPARRLAGVIVSGAEGGERFDEQPVVAGFASQHHGLVTKLQRYAIST